MSKPQSFPSGLAVYGEIYLYEMFDESCGIPHEVSSDEGESGLLARSDLSPLYQEITEKDGPAKDNCCTIDPQPRKR